MWSEHCSYKSSRIHLKKLPTRGKLRGAGSGRKRGHHRNRRAAGWSRSRSNRTITELHRAVSGRGHGRRRHSARHLHHGRAAHRRDGFASLRAASTIPNGRHNRRILEGVVSGIAHYGNCFGVPTVGGECIFEECYSGNPLVNVFALGVCKRGRDFLRARSGIGNPVIYVGAKTGRDGIHGASMASAPNSPRNRSRSARTCRWAIRSSKSCCSKPAWKP